MIAPTETIRFVGLYYFFIVGDCWSLHSRVAESRTKHVLQLEIWWH